MIINVCHSWNLSEDCHLQSIFYTGTRANVLLRDKKISYKMLQDEVIFPASNAGIVDLPEGRLPRSYR